jgi:hypothetical protein
MENPDIDGRVLCGKSATCSRAGNIEAGRRRPNLNASHAGERLPARRD